MAVDLDAPFPPSDDCQSHPQNRCRQSHPQIDAFRVIRCRPPISPPSRPVVVSRESVQIDVVSAIRCRPPISPLSRPVVVSCESVQCFAPSPALRHLLLCRHPLMWSFLFAWLAISFLYDTGFFVYLGNRAVGKKIFKTKCAQCHTVDKGAGHKQAKQTPLTTNQLHRALKSKLPYIERNLGSVVSVIRHSIQNADAFEEAAKYLKKKCLESSNSENALAPEDSEVLPSEASEFAKSAEEVLKKQSSSSANDTVVKDSHKTAAVPMHRDPEDTHTPLSSSHSFMQKPYTKDHLDEVGMEWAQRVQKYVV